ncbi:spore coat protein SA [Paenibacillus sp. GP183]|nr:spore coat protein SA [Paenibacillus sp. GP183]
MICLDSLPCPPIKSGAIELLIDRVAPYLVSTYDHVTVFSIQDPSLSNRETINHVEFIRFQRSKYLKEVLRYLENNFFDLIQVYNKPDWIFPIKKASPGSRLVLSLHNLILGNRVDDQVSQQAVDVVDHIVTVSQFVARDVVHRYPAAPGKITTIYTGDDHSLYTPHYSSLGSQIELRMKRAMGIPDDYLVILFVGRLIPKKGCHILIEAMKKVGEQHPKTALVIIGSKWYGEFSDNEYVKKIKKKSQKISEHIYFNNFISVNEITDYYTMSDILVCPSQWKEPLARVHYEAMAAGIPIVTTNRGGNSEVIVNGKNGYVIDQYDQAQAFVAAINKLLDSKRLREKMGYRNRKLIKNRYNFKRYALHLSKLYKELKVL